MIARHYVNPEVYCRLIKPRWVIEVRRTPTYDYIAIVGSTPSARASLSLCDGRMRSLHILSGSPDGPACVDLASPGSAQFARLLAGVLVLSAECLRHDRSGFIEVDRALTGADVFGDPLEHLRWLASVRA